MADVLDLIDNAIDGWHGSPDAMRWTPPRSECDEPIVRAPRGPVEILVAAGWDGYAAEAYPAIALRNGYRVIRDVYEQFAEACQKLMPGVARMQQKLLIQVDGLVINPPPPFWTVQPQSERRR